MPKTPTEKWDRLYERVAKYRPLGEAELDSLLESAGKMSGREIRSILDLGCGTGELAEQLSSRGLHVVGLDGSGVALEKAEAKNLPNAEFIQADLATQDWPKLVDSRDFDLITCKLVVAFLPDREAFLRRVRDLMREGAVFSVISPVLHNGIEYVPEDKPGIAVGYAEFDRLLKDIFMTVEELPPIKTGERTEIRTWLARK